MTSELDARLLTLPAVIRRHGRLNGDGILVACDGQRLTYCEAERRSRALARGFIAAGIGKGAHIALLLPSGIDFVICTLAAARIGAVTVPLSTLSSAEELRWLLANSDARCLIAAPGSRARDLIGVLCSALPSFDWSSETPLSLSEAPWLRNIWLAGDTDPTRKAWSLDTLYTLGLAIEDALLDAVERRVMASDRLVIIHTSGSTNAPKGVIHTHGNLIEHLYNVNDVRRLVPGEALFSSSPWFWVAGFSYALLGTIVAGAKLICSNATEASDVLDHLERERPTITNGYPMTVARLAQDPTFPTRDLSSIRRGNLWPIMPADVRAADPTLRHNIYGMTEVGGVVTMSRDESDLEEKYRGSCGSVLPGFEVRIVDPDTGCDRAVGEVGELWLRSRFLMQGYYGRLRSEVFEPDEWWRTGDMGYFDAEGFFYVAGRRGEMIKTSGANVAPREVEAVLQDLAGGRQCFVLGVPDALRGEIVVAVVVCEASDALDEALLVRKAGEKLSRYKVPRRILQFNRADIPLLSSGKVNTRRLAQIVAERCRELGAGESLNGR